MTSYIFADVQILLEIAVCVECQKIVIPHSVQLKSEKNETDAKTNVVTNIH